MSADGIHLSQPEMAPHVPAEYVLPLLASVVATDPKLASSVLEDADITRVQCVGQQLLDCSFVCMALLKQYRAHPLLDAYINGFQTIMVSIVNVHCGSHDYGNVLKSLLQSRTRGSCAVSKGTKRVRVRISLEKIAEKVTFFEVMEAASRGSESVPPPSPGILRMPVELYNRSVFTSWFLNVLRRVGLAINRGAKAPPMVCPVAYLSDPASADCSMSQFIADATSNRQCASDTTAPAEAPKEKDPKRRRLAVLADKDSADTGAGGGGGAAGVYTESCEVLYGFPVPENERGRKTLLTETEKRVFGVEAVRSFCVEDMCRFMPCDRSPSHVGLKLTKKNSKPGTSEPDDATASTTALTRKHILTPRQYQALLLAVAVLERLLAESTPASWAGRGPIPPGWKPPFLWNLPFWTAVSRLFPAFPADVLFNLFVEKMLVVDGAATIKVSQKRQVLQLKTVFMDTLEDLAASLCVTPVFSMSVPAEYSAPLVAAAAGSGASKSPAASLVLWCIDMAEGLVHNCWSVMVRDRYSHTIEYMVMCLQLYAPLVVLVDTLTVASMFLIQKDSADADTGTDGPEPTADDLIQLALICGLCSFRFGAERGRDVPRFVGAM